MPRRLLRASRHGLAALLLLASPFAVGVDAVAAAPEDERLRFACDPRTSTLELPAASAVALPAGSEVVAVDWIDLLEWGPDRNPAGDPLRAGTRRASRRCGDLTVLTEAGFLNANALGELGALEFPVVEVRRGDTVVVPRTALEECDRSSARFAIYGECPAGYAVSIAVRRSADGKGREVLYVRSYRDRDLAERTQRETRPVPSSDTGAVRKNRQKTKGTQKE